MCTSVSASGTTVESAIEGICDRRQRKGLEYFVKWKNCSEENNSWVSAKDLDCKNLIDAFEAAYCKTATVNESPGTKNNNRAKKKRKSESVKKRCATPTPTPTPTHAGGDDSLSENSTKSDAFNSGHEAELIMGAIQVEGLKFFLVKFKGVEEAKWLSSNLANMRIPQMVIKFYEQRVKWDLPTT